MRSGLFQGHNYGQPSMYVGGHPHAADLGSRPPVQNQSIGFPTNATVPHEFTMNKRKGGYEKSIDHSQLAFIEHHDVPQKSSNPKGLTTINNLPMMNYVLYKLALQAKGETDETAAQKRTSAAFLDDVLQRFSLLGVAIRQHTIGDPLRMNHPVLNTVIRGRARTFNLWGRVRDGDRLYLTLCVVKRVRGDEFLLDAEVGKPMPPDATIDCFQFVPTVADSDGAPSKRHGEHPQQSLYLGRVHRTPLTYPEPPNPTRIRASLSEHLRSDRVEVWVDC